MPSAGVRRFRGPFDPFDGVLLAGYLGGGLQPFAVPGATGPLRRPVCVGELGLRAVAFPALDVSAEGPPRQSGLYLRAPGCPPWERGCSRPSRPSRPSHTPSDLRRDRDDFVTTVTTPRCS